MVSPVEVAHEHIPLLLQVVLVLWDHYTPVVQDQAREMLVHLIHELVISKIDDDTIGIDKRSIEDFIEGVRQHDVKVVWNYDDKNGKDAEDSGGRSPEVLLACLSWAQGGLGSSRSQLGYIMSGTTSCLPILSAFPLHPQFSGSADAIRHASSTLKHHLG